MSPSPPVDQRQSRHRVLVTLLVVAGMLDWLAGAFVMFALSPMVLAVAGTGGGLFGGWLASQVRTDLRRGEAAVAAALAVLILGGLAELRGTVELDGAARAIVALGALGAAAAAWLAVRPRDGHPPWLIRILVAGAIAMATVVVVGTVLVSLGRAGIEASPNGEFLLVIAVSALGGIAAARLTPEATAFDVFVGQALVVFTVLAYWLASTHLAATVVVAVPVAALFAVPGTVAARLTLGLRGGPVRPGRPRHALPVARLRA